MQKAWYKGLGWFVRYLTKNPSWPGYHDTLFRTHLNRYNQLIGCRPVRKTVAMYANIRDLILFQFEVVVYYGKYTSFSLCFNMHMLFSVHLIGVGFGMMYLCCYVMIGHYFEKRRAFATGLASCGSGVGTFLFAPLSVYLITQFGWKGKL